MEALCILGTTTLLGVGVSFGITAAKSLHPDKNIVLISGDGAFLSGGLSIEAAFQENKPITIVIDNNGGLDMYESATGTIVFKWRGTLLLISAIFHFTRCARGMGGYGELSGA